MNAKTKKDFELYGEAIRIFRELSAPEMLSRLALEERWQRIAEIEKLLSDKMDHQSEELVSP
jgi:hypothetical protein